MKVGFKITVVNVESQRYAANTNGPWPEDDLRALNTAVRQDIKGTVQHVLDNIPLFEELGIKVEVQ